jgi:hypothetical protein
MSTDYRALLSDVLTTLESYYPAETQGHEFPADLCDVLNRARRALAQPDLVGEAELELFHRYKRLGLIRPDAIFPSALAQPEPVGPTDTLPWQWYSYCPEDGIELHLTKELAQKAARETMGEYARHAHSDGWHEDMESVSWGALLPAEKAHVIERVEAEPGSEFDEWVRYDLRPVDAVLARWSRPVIEAPAQPEPVGPTDEDYIDCDITGSDRTLLDQFYAGAQREGGSADEVTLRGIHAVLDLLKSPEPTRVELAAMWQEQYGDCSATMTFAEFIDAARAVLARWGNPTLTPIPMSERLPMAEDCDAEGRCWFSSCLNADGRWNLEDRTSGLNSRWYSHWLPAHDLPLAPRHRPTTAPRQPAPDAPAP